MHVAHRLNDVSYAIRDIYAIAKEVEKNQENFLSQYRGPRAFPGYFFNS